MTTIAERLVAELGKLSPAELREIWQRVGIPPEGTADAPISDERTALEVVHSLYGRFAGGDMTVHLLQDRARERARGEQKLRRHAPRQDG